MRKPELRTPRAYKEAALLMAARAEFIEGGGRTLRCHTQPMLQRQTVAEHSYGVAWWCYLLTQNKPSVNLLMAALAHDVAEHITGDVPSPTKEHLGIRGLLNGFEVDCFKFVDLPHVEAELTDDEKRVLRIADSLELMQHCVRERVMGNRHKDITSMYINVAGYARELLREGDEVAAWNIVNDKWKEYNK